MKIVTLSNLSRKFSITFDLYLSTKSVVDQQVQVALRRNTPDWRLHHACPACTYKLSDEQPLHFSLLCTMDGNDLLKRILHHGPAEETDGSVEATPSPVIEGPDSQVYNSSYYLSRVEVDKWAEGLVQEMMPEKDGQVRISGVGAVLSLADSTLQGDSEENPCADCWRNMIVDVTKRMRGIFDETGVFLALCRHGFALVVADMVRSGEL